MHPSTPSSLSPYFPEDLLISRPWVKIPFLRSQLAKLFQVPQKNSFSPQLPVLISLSLCDLQQAPWPDFPAQGIEVARGNAHGQKGSIAESCRAGGEARLLSPMALPTFQGSLRVDTDLAYPGLPIQGLPQTHLGPPSPPRIHVLWTAADL